MRKVALVTGGAVRVGRAITLGLAEAGFDLVVNYHASEGPAREVARKVEGLGRQALTVQADVSDPEAVDTMAERVRERFGRLDLLVNNASIFRAQPFLEVDLEGWDEVIGVNLKGPFLVLRSTADLLTEAHGSVINIVDLSAFTPFMEYPHHSVSKAGLLHMTRIMASALAPRVRVNAIAPGTVLPPEDMTEEERDRAVERTALKRLGSPEDVVRTVLFLAGSDFVTGEVIVVDGGRRVP